MAVFRIEKTQNYTVMSNHHLRNVSLSLKAKGLLSQILSVREENQEKNRHRRRLGNLGRNQSFRGLRSGQSGFKKDKGDNEA